MENKRKNCPLRHKSNGNCLPCGGFCTAVNDAICEAIHQAYDHGFSDGYRKAKADASWDTPPFLLATDMKWGAGKMCKKNCLFCVNSLSADAPDCSQVLCCFNVPGHEGSERWVDEEDAETCMNYKET